MRPISLCLKNYRAFGEAGLDLSRVEAAAIVGANGAGKSTIPEAILFALYGETRSTDVDGPVKLGAEEAVVELTYELTGAKYQIIRKRSRGKKSSLDYLISDGSGEWTALTGASIADTQTKIERDLGMSKALCLASSCVMQGQSAGICEAGPADRKRILMEVLADRLAKFGPMAEAAKAEVKRIDETLSVTRAERSRLEAVIAERDELMASSESRRADLCQSREAVVSLEQELANLDQSAAGDRASRDKLQSLTDDINKQRAELNRIGAWTSGVNHKIGETEILLERADEIRANCAELARVEKSLVNARESKDRYQNLGRQFEAKRAELDPIGERLGAEEKRLQDRIEAAKSRLTGAAQRQSLVNEVPCKDSPMAAECKLLVNARTAGEEIKQIEEEIVGFEIESTKLSDQIRIHSERYSTELEPLREQAKGCGYDSEAHQVLEHEAANLAPARDLLPRIERAAAENEAAVAALETLNRRADDVRAAIQTLESERQSLEAAIGDTPWAQLKQAAESQLQEIRESVERLAREIGGLEERLDQIAKADDRLNALAVESSATEQRRAIFFTLQQAFGRDGIPALIIDHAIPQIEEMANEILSRLSAGRMNVRFATQKATKTAGIAETLDIIISDTAGERPYEDYSGGERLRVDLAVRIALGRILAARTGAKIETLILDEVCAPLDEAGEEALVDCVNRLRESFGCILLITHRESLRDRLPQQISVVRNGSDSCVEVIT